MSGGKEGASSVEGIFFNRNSDGNHWRFTRCCTKSQRASLSALHPVSPPVAAGSERGQRHSRGVGTETTTHLMQICSVLLLCDLFLASLCPVQTRESTKGERHSTSRPARTLVSAFLPRHPPRPPPPATTNLSSISTTSASQRCSVRGALGTGLCHSVQFPGGPDKTWTFYCQIGHSLKA